MALNTENILDSGFTNELERLPTGFLIFNIFTTITINIVTTTIISISTGIICTMLIEWQTDWRRM